MLSMIWMMLIGFTNFRNQAWVLILLTSLGAEIEGLKFTAGIHRRDYHDYHRLICKTFPYAIYYTSENNEVVIWAIIDCRRDPDWIQSHLDK